MNKLQSRSNGVLACALFFSLASSFGFAQQRPRAASPARVAPRATPFAGAHIRPHFVPNRYMVFLADPPVSARYTKREDLETSAAAAYRGRIQTTQQNLARDLGTRNIRVTGSVDTLLNAVFVAVTPDRLAEIRALPGVIGVMPERGLKKNLNKATQLANAPAAWANASIGGQANAGNGIKIGILDSGIDQTNPAFNDSGFSLPAGTWPKCNAPSDCANFTNKKVIVARSYVPQIAAQATCASPSLSGCNLPTNPVPNPATSSPDDYSARDRDGHGTSVASSAAAVLNSGGSITFSGMAPRAYLGSYKIGGSIGVNDYAPESVFIQALEDALKDGMDIVNMSSGFPAVTGALDTTACGNPSGVPCDPLAMAFETAAQAGLVITVAAGNSGDDTYIDSFYGVADSYPYYNSIVSPATAPSVISVGATINSHALGSLVSVQSSNAPSSLKAIAAQRSDSLFGSDPLSGACCSSPGLTAPLVDVTTLGDNGLLCSPLSGSLAGKFALIQRGTCTFDAKAVNAANAGAAGIVMYMADGSATISPEGITTDFSGPVVMIALSDGQALKSYIDSNPGASVLIDTGGQEITGLPWITSAVTNSLASFSSMGPTPDGKIKPDLVATGGYDFWLDSDFIDGNTSVPYPNGMYVATQHYDQNSIGYSATGFTGADGTSLAAPLVAGAAALVKQAHPAWTAGQIKSALVNYSAQDVTMDDFGDTVDVEWIGAGRLDANAGVTATVSAEPATLSFGFLKTGVALPGPISVKITNLGTTSVTLAVAVATGIAASGTTVSVSSSSITLAAGANTTLSVTLSGAVPAPGEYNGAITLKSSTPSVSLRIPYMFIVGDGVPFNINSPYGCCYGAVGTDLSALPIQVTDQYGAPVAGASVAWTVSPRGAVTLRSATGTPGNTGNIALPYTPVGCSPASSSTGVTCPTDNYGNAWVDVLGGTATTSTATICASVGSTFSCANSAGYSFPVTLIPAPTVSTGGVVDNGAYQSTVAPGSYVDIFGSNLMDPNFLANSSGDLTTYTRLPLTLDSVTVSFDAPASGSLPAISVPGYVLFVSPGQVNAFVPWELQNYPSAKAKITFVESLYSNLVNVPLANYVPAFHSNLVNNVFVADAIDATMAATCTPLPTCAVITPSNPAAAGDILELYVNGLGPVTNPPASGDPACGFGVTVGSCTASSPTSQTTSPVTVSIGGKQAQVYNSVGYLASGYVGLYQVNVTVPSGLGAGNQAITISVGGKTSPSQVVTSTANYPIVLPTK